MEEPMKIYIDSKEKYNDTRSTAWTFTIVGIIGLVLLALIWLDILPIHFDSVNRILTTAVMGVLFLIFILVGIKSFLSLKNINEKGQKQDDKIDEIKKWFMDEYTDQMIVQFDDSVEENDQELYFQRYNFIFNTIRDYNIELPEDLIDHIAEELYSEIYNEN